MRQLLIIAVETSEPLDLAEIAVALPPAAKAVRMYGEAIAEPFTDKAVRHAARACVQEVACYANIDCGYPVSDEAIVRRGNEILKQWAIQRRLMDAIRAEAMATAMCDDRKAAA